MLFSDFRARGPISILTPPIVVLTEFFFADTETNVYPLTVSWYFIHSVCMCLCSCTHIMSMLWSIVVAFSTGSWYILFKVLTLNIIISIMLLHFSNFCFTLSSLANISNTVTRAPTSAGRASFLRTGRAMWFGQVVWVWVMVIFRWLRFILTHRSHPYRWAAVAPRSNFLILVVFPRARPIRIC